MPLSNGDRAKMIAANQLIKEKRYSEARGLLQGINDPKALDWLSKIERLSPTRGKRGFLTPILTIALIVIVGSIIIVGVVLKQEIDKVPATLIPQITTIPTIVIPPSSTPAPEIVATDCGANEWWNYVGGSTIDYMNALVAAAGLLRTLEAKGSGNLGTYDDLGFESQLDSMDESRTKVKDRDYPLCAKQAHDALDSGMLAYHLYLQEREFKLYPILAGAYTDTELAQFLAQGQQNMKLAADEIHRLTGQDTQFLLQDTL